MDWVSRSRGWDKEIPHGVLTLEQLVLGDMWARIIYASSQQDKKIRRSVGHTYSA